jgi:membrane protein
VRMAGTAKRDALLGAAAVAGLLALGARARHEGDKAVPTTSQGRSPGRIEYLRREQPNRGRQSSRACLARGRPDWKMVADRIREDLTKRRIITIAAGVTFYSLLAVFPAIAALVALYGMVADPGTIAQNLGDLSSFMPGGAIDVIGDQINRIAAQSTGALGLTVLVGVAALLWSANGGVKALFDALNVVYGADERRSFVRLNAVSLAFVTGGILFILVAIGMVVALPPLLQHLGLESQTKGIIDIARWPALLIAVALWLAFIYRFGPDRPEPKWRWITWGSAFASVAWLIASLLFSWYAAKFGSFNKTYGSLGAVIGFMMWIWISAIVVLMGAELDSVMEKPAETPAGSEPRPELRGSS